MNLDTPTLMVPLALLEALVDYVMRYAEQSEEPAGGDCWTVISEAKSLADLP